MKNKILEKFADWQKYLVIGLLIFLGLSLLRNLAKVREVRKTIERERVKVAKLKAENERMGGEIVKSQSDEFIEKQLRDKLGLAKKGEIVLVLPDAETLRKLAPEIPEEENSLPDPNWKRWAHLFGL